MLVERKGGALRDLTPAGFNVRTRVHEYGGGAAWLAGDVARMVNVVKH